MCRMTLCFFLMLNYLVMCDAVSFSYARVDTDSITAKQFVIGAGFKASITFTGTERNGTLMVAYKNPNQFLLLDILDGAVSKSFQIGSLQMIIPLYRSNLHKYTITMPFGGLDS